LWCCEAGAGVRGIARALKGDGAVGAEVRIFENTVRDAIEVVALVENVVVDERPFVRREEGG